MQILIQSTYESIRIADSSLREYLAGMAVPQDMISACELALHELLTNLVDHAYEGDPQGQIEVVVMVNDAKLLMETHDTGLPFRINFSDVSMPDPSELAESGYGLAIIQALVDDVKYFSNNGQNTWQLIKHLA